MKFSKLTMKVLMSHSKTKKRTALYIYYTIAITAVLKFTQRYSVEELLHAAAAVSLIPGLGNSGPTSKHVSLKFLPQFCTSFLSPDSSSVPGIFTSTVVPTSLQKAPSCMHPLTTCIDNIERSQCLIHTQATRC